MVPLKLSLRNFLCYRDGVPTLDLNGVSVACLCGENGHGKSALLDAITWALWGKARGKAQDDLIHMAEDEMQVELEFQARGQTYRVVRRHARSGRRQRTGSDLQLQVWTGEGFRSITGNSQRETQKRLEELIGMDYQTFINSAFLLQGRADEFTNKTPNERKEVLAKVLGFDYYDGLEALAKEQAAQQERLVRDVEMQLQGLQQEVAHKEQVEASLKEVEQELAQVATLLEAEARKQETLRLEVGELQRQRQEAEEVRRRLPAIEAEVQDFLREAALSEKKLAQYQALMEQREEVEAGFRDLQQSRLQYEALNQSLARLSELRSQATPLEQALRQQEAQLLGQAQSLRHRLEKDIRPKTLLVSQLQEQLAKAKAKLEELAAEERMSVEARAGLTQLAASAGQLRSIGERLKAEGQELRAKLDLLQRSSGEARCPLCNSELGPQGCQHLAQSYEAQIQEKRRLFQENQEELKRVEAERARLERDLPAREKELRRAIREVQGKAASLEHQLQEAVKAGQEVQSLEAELSQVEQRLKTGDFALEERRRLAVLESQVQSLGYDPALHQQARQRVEALQGYEERYRLLQEAVQGVPQERERRERALHLARRRQEELEQMRARIAQIEAATGRLPSLEEELAQVERRKGQLEATQRAVLARKGDLEGRLRRMAQAEQEMASKRRELQRLSQEVSVYRDLAQAFGKKGLQAMLIESVLPELEREANELLGRMTGYRMSVKLETQRERKSAQGEFIETLEIKISDELGTRSYEMFSGGEAFRINLALRIALSRILAQRRGAPLPTLFIDEGFGTQDAAGRERIIEVIQAIQSYFQKIIVITHLDEVKDAFPVRIDVVKTDCGSTFWVN